MPIRVKFAIILISIFFFFGIANYVIQQLIILPSFLSLEQDEAIADANHVLKNIDREIYHLDSLAHDWAAWDDTYEYVKSPSADYIAANLVLSSFTDNDINMIYICDTEGKVLWGKIFDIQTNAEIHLENIPKDHFPKDHPLITYNTNIPMANIKVAGIFMTSKGPMLISSRPILNSNNEGPIRGFFIMGRLFSTPLFKSLSEHADVDLEILPIQVDILPEAIKKIVAQISDRLPHLVENNKEKNLIRVFTLLPDIEGNAALLIKSETQSKIVAKGKNALNVANYSILVACLCALVVILVIIKLTILIPIKKLTHYALEFKESGNLSNEPPLRRRDEIGTLARRFNDVFNQLETKSKKLKELNEILHVDLEFRKTILSESPIGIAIYNAASGQFIEGNKSLIKIFEAHKKQILTNNLFNIEIWKKAGLIETANKALAENARKQLEISTKTDSGKEKAIDCHIVPFLAGINVYLLFTFFDITDRKNTVIELNDSQNELRRLASHLQKAIEKERVIIAREIHDDLGQTLSALKLNIGWIKKRILPDQETITAKLSDMSMLITNSIQTVKKISQDLRPVILDGIGLISAMEWHASKFQELTKIQCKLSFELEDVSLFMEINTDIFRIFQEALTNISRHAYAGEVHVFLKQEPEQLILEIVDNGKGVKESDLLKSTSFGIVGMRERVLALNGTFSITGDPGQCTIIFVSFPIKQQSQ